jgi:sugar phosphate isomerase/epimerase
MLFLLTAGISSFQTTVSVTINLKVTIMTTRRDFVKKSALIVAAVPFMKSDILAGSGPSGKTGLILYTIRDAMKQSPAKALAEAAAIGFDWVEAADHNNMMFYGLKPKEFEKMVKQSGMVVLSSHSAIRPENDNQMIEDVAEAGMKYIVLPSLPQEWSSNLDGYQRAADFLNKTGLKCRKAGLKMAFHNHQTEFKEINGNVPYEILLENTDPALVVFEMDLAWITAAGKDPIAYFTKYPGRFELWHIKDLTPEKQDATLGEGIIDFKPILAQAKTAGMKYWFLEQDNCRTHTPMESIAISRTYYLEKLLK